MENTTLKEKEYAKALKEVFVILKNTEEEVLKFIPQSFIELIEENMDKEYAVNFEELTEEKMKNETKAIIALISRDFLKIKTENQNDDTINKTVEYEQLLKNL